MGTVLSPLATRFEGAYYDGQRPLRLQAEAEFCADELKIHLPDDSLSWPYVRMRVAADGRNAEPIRLELARENGAVKQVAPVGETLVIADPRVMDVIRQHPDLRLPPEALLSGLRGWPAVLLTCAVLVAFGSMAYVWGVGLMADTLAAITPPFVEDRLGKAVVNILAPEATRCGDSRRAELLHPVLARLESALGTGQHFEIIYTSHAIPNAFAAPGGYIVVFQGLLQQTATPEEFAAVLAHEMMHVRHRHSMKALTRQLSAQTLLSVMAMDSAGTPAALEGVVKLGNLRYQRGDEEEADLEGARLLQRAHIDATSMATFFRRLAGDSRFAEPSVAYFSSHPALHDRARLVEAEALAGSGTVEALIPMDDWREVLAACLDRGAED